MEGEEWGRGWDVTHTQLKSSWSYKGKQVTNKESDWELDCRKTSAVLCVSLCESAKKKKMM